MYLTVSYIDLPGRDKDSIAIVKYWRMVASHRSTIKVPRTTIKGFLQGYSPFQLSVGEHQYRKTVHLVLSLEHPGASVT